MKWMDSSAPFTMVPETNYCNIIVPTMDTVQMSYLLGMLLTNHKPVSAPPCPASPYPKAQVRVAGPCSTLGPMRPPLSQVLCIGPTGTGKTLTISDKLLKNLPLEYISHFLIFSARTSANQTQDLIDSKLDKRQALLPSFLGSKVPPSPEPGGTNGCLTSPPNYAPGFARNLPSGGGGHGGWGAAALP